MKIKFFPIWFLKSNIAIEIQIGKLCIYLGRYYQHIWIVKEEKKDGI